MPLFEAVQDRTPLIFDIGTAYTKCGFAGENAPRCIIASEFKKKNGELFHVHDCSLSEDELHDGLVEFFYHIYFRELLVNPMVRRVVVTEPLFATINFKRALSHVLFMQYEVPSIYFASIPILSLLSLAIPVAMVVDCGFRETVILPVYHSFPIFKACQVIPAAGKAIHTRLREQLMDEGMVKTEQKTQLPVTQFKEKLTEKLIENIKVKTCFITTYDRAQQIRKALNHADAIKPESPPGVDYPMDGKLILHIPGKMREQTCELLFERGDDDDCIASLIIQAINKCPIDSRKEMAENIVLLGGTCMLAGFKGRLLNELKGISGEDKYKGMFQNYSFKIHTPPCQENVAGWLGGAIFGAVDVVLSMRSTPREQYIATHRVPDWSEIRDKGDLVDDRFKETPYIPTPRTDMLQ